VTIYLFVPLLVIVALLQATIVPRVLVWGVHIDLPLVVVVSWSLLEGSREGLRWGFVAGLAVDLFSGAPFGAATLSMLAVGFLSGFGHATVFRARAILYLGTVFLATLIYDLLFLLVVWISGADVLWLESFWRILLPSAMLNTAVTPVVFVILYWLRNRFSQEEMEW
jgi:rod shape-determining protein MreD